MRRRARGTRRGEPLLDPRLFGRRGFRAGTITVVVQFLAVFGLRYLLLILGYSPLKAAVALVPVALLVIPVSLLTPRLLNRFGPARRDTRRADRPGRWPAVDLPADCQFRIAVPSSAACSSPAPGSGWPIRPAPPRSSAHCRCGSNAWPPRSTTPPARWALFWLEAIAGDGVLRLRVRNDGVSSAPPAAQPAAGDRAGRGLANLTTRVQAAGGRLTSGYDGEWFHLVAELPESGPLGATTAASAVPPRLPSLPPGRPAGSR